VTSYIANSLDLASFLSTRPSSPARSRAFSSIRKLFHKCHQNGILHPDCNARNILLTQSPGHAWLLDVDAIQVEPQNPSRVDIANRNRLLRSLLKLAKLGALGFTETEVPSLWRELFPSS
jgi:tRNA A-37 threonylcarbamoyl transferase component Bud32